MKAAMLVEGRKDMLVAEVLEIGGWAGADMRIKAHRGGINRSWGFIYILSRGV